MGGFFHSMEYKLEELKTGVHPMVDSMFLMSGPVPITTILLVYLYFVLKFGPNYMKNRKPLDLKHIMILYNAYQVVFSIWFCIYTYNVQNIKNYFASSNGCTNSKIKDESGLRIFWVGAWWYFFSKVIELLDTVFFVLRKKQSQVSFLHVFHHTITCFSAWCYLKYIPGEQGIIIGFLNSFTHVIMYSYYLLSALGPKYQKYLWWKKYITRVQLIQFGLMFSYLSYTMVFDCNVPRSLTLFFMANCIIYAYLFSDFYRKAYIKNKKLKAEKDANVSMVNVGDNSVASTSDVSLEKQQLNGGDHIRRRSIKSFVSME